MYQQRRVSNMQLREMKISSQSQLEELVATLSALRLQGEIKIVNGGFQLSAMIDAEFIEKATGQKWRLRCVNGAHGGGSLVRSL
jgi:hypothetical protein